MQITDVKVRKLFDEGPMKAIVSVTFDNQLAVHDIKVIEGPERLFVAMPSRKDESGAFRDIAHPITSAARGLLEHVILDKYREYMEAQAHSDETLRERIAEMPEL